MNHLGKMEDSDLMPFGKHKNHRLDDIPASYLLWLYDQDGFKNRNAELADYIDENRVLLEKEVGE